MLCAGIVGLPNVGKHTFRPTGITAHLKNGGHLETVHQMAGHDSQGTTNPYDRREEKISLGEVAGIAV